MASRDESKLSSVKLFFWENLDERQRRRECEGQLPIRIRLTFHARFRYFSPPTLQFYLLLFYIPFSLLLFPIYTRDFTYEILLTISNAINFHTFRSNFSTISPTYWKQGFVRAKARKKESMNQFSSHSTPSSRAFSIPRGTSRPKVACTPGCACVSPDTARGSSSQPGT